MLITGIKRILKSRLATCVMTCAVFFAPVENAFAVPDFSLSNTVFSSFSKGPPQAHMDAAGTWDNIANVEVSPARGDTFIFSVSNNIGGGATTAFDFDFTIDVPPGFSLASSINQVDLNAVGTCATSLIGRTISQSFAGADINISVPNNSHIPPGCTYNFEIELTTNTSAAACNAGTLACEVRLNVDYRLTDNGTAASTAIVHDAQVNAGAIQVIKTATTLTAANLQPVIFDVQITNSGGGGMFNVELTDFLTPPNLTNLSIVPPASPPGFANVPAGQYTFYYLAPGEVVNLTVNATASIDPTDTTCPIMRNDASVIERRTSIWGNSGSDSATVDFDLDNSLQLSHVLASSYCELCGTGTVRLRVENTGGISLENINITENLMASGLTYDTNGITQISINGGPLQPTGAPQISGASTADEILIWTPVEIPELTQMDSPFAVPAPPNPISIEIVFGVVRAVSFAGITEEGLTSAIRNIEPTATYDLICNNISKTAAGAQVELPIRQPVPQVTKLGRNIDAAQGTYLDTVYGHIEDSVIWRVQVQNTGLANMEDLLVDDVIDGNFDINWVCRPGFDLNDAVARTSGAAPTGCVSIGGGISTAVLDLDMDDNISGTDGFTEPPDDEPGTYIDVSAGNSTFIYYVGRIQAACSPNIQNEADIEWGCEDTTPPIDEPPGGLILPASTNGAPPAYSILSNAILEAEVTNTGLGIQQNISGINGNANPGSNGIVTIQITNLTGGTINGFDFTDTLPPEYVVDPSFIPTMTVAPFYGANYLGMVDTITWDNQDADPLNNIAPHFTLSTDPASPSRPVSTLPGDDRDLIRHGDILTIQFGIVLIDDDLLDAVTHYDLVADVDVKEENSTDGTDPNPGPTRLAPGPTIVDFTIDNTIRVSFDDICGNTNLSVADDVQTFDVDIEDLDVDISDDLFILTNDTLTPLALNVLLSNMGGHDADNYTLYVTFGQAMTVQGVAPNCSLVDPVIEVAPNRPLHADIGTPVPLWNKPKPVPDSAAMYRCNRGPIPFGTTETFTFTVVKEDPTANPDDDLTFRADVVGEIRLFDGTNFAALPLDFPTTATLADTTPAKQLANNYSLDTIRSRVLGFNLTKTVWHCKESGDPEIAPPVQFDDFLTYPLPTELNTQIGEDCHYFIESGGWFGFLTPSFTLIKVENVVVDDVLPAGQGFIPFDATKPYDFHNTGGIELSLPATTGGATTTEFSTTGVTWSFNATNAITIRDEFFRVNLKTRLLNDPLDLVYTPTFDPLTYLPNVHATISTNTATTSFQAIFEDTVSGITQIINVDETLGIPGYPLAPVRQVNLTEIEPNLLITKQVCNETLSISQGAGSGANCNGGVFSDFIASGDVNAGDSKDNYVYKISITNEAAAGAPAVTRAPAFNVIITDLLDSSDLMVIAPATNAVDPFEDDGLDNDGDGFTDSIAFGGDDADGEFFSLSENVANAGGPATFIISHEHSDALDQIDPGQTVTYYYRIDPHQDVAPLETLDNTVTTTYDSLAGDFGNQNAPQLLNSEVARPEGRARIYTAIDATSSIQMRPLIANPKQVIDKSNPTIYDPQFVVVGEEVLYELYAQIPVAKLRNFKIRDELPPGLRCVDAQTVDLNALPYSNAAFRTNGAVNPAAFTATCDQTGLSNVIEWDFGDQELTAGVPGTLFDFRVRFIARVENTDTTIEGCNLRNGGAAAGVPTVCSTDSSVAILTYEDESGTGIPVVLTYGAVDVVVREPDITVAKTFAVAAADAEDILEVTVTITNNGDIVSSNTATAYNLEILDDLTGKNMTFQELLGVAGTNPPDNIDTATLGPNQPIFSWNSTSADYAIAPAEVKSFTFKVKVDGVVQPIEELDNTIDARWRSLPDTDAIDDIDPPFAARSIDPDGDELGMRVGQLTGFVLVDPVLNPRNDYNATDTALVTVPPLTNTKNDLNPAVIPAIGELKEFEIVITLPEGVTNDVVITDNLAASDVSYFIENNADYDITYTFNGIEFINDRAPSEAAFGADPDVSTDGGFPGNNASGPVIWDIGKVDTGVFSEDDTAINAVDPSITIHYYARINNDLVTGVFAGVGTKLLNGIDLTYLNGANTPATENPPPLATPAEITAIEPELTVSKIVSNQTQANADTDAGDLLRYVVTINNIGNATAFDTNIVDTIPPGVLLDLSVANAPTATLDAAVIPTFISTPTNSLASPLIWGRNNADETLDIPAGSELILTYYLIVQDGVLPGQILDNSVVVDWTSLDGSSVLIDARERTGGVDCAAIVLPDDYCTAPFVANLAVTDNNFITKIYNSDTFAPFDDALLRIGDIVEYTLTLSMQEGTTTNMQIQDTLPPSMEFRGVVSINGDTGTGVTPNIVYSDTAIPFEYVGDNIIQEVDITGAGTNVLNINIGDVIVDSDNDPNNNDFVIIYTAQVVQDVLPQLPTTTPLTNTANFNYNDINGPPALPPKSQSLETITALQPYVVDTDVIKERFDSAYLLSIPSGSPAASGSTIYFRLSACNSGDAPAYDMVLVDDLNPVPGTFIPQLASEFDLGSVSEPVVTVNGALATKGVDYSYPGVVGSVMTITLDGVAVNPFADNPDNCVVVEYNVMVDPILGGGNSWDNKFLIDSYASVNFSEANTTVRDRRQLYDTDIEAPLFNLNNINPIEDPSKAYLSINKPDDIDLLPLTPITARDPTLAAVGELITYQIVVPAVGMNSPLQDVLVIDDMDPSLSFVRAYLVAPTANDYGFEADEHLNTTASVGNQVRIRLSTTTDGIINKQLDALNRATINVVARVANNTNANTLTAPFPNSVRYEFSNIPGGTAILGGVATTNLANNISIVEPELDTVTNLATKTVTNITKPGGPPATRPDAGDILEYTITYSFLGGAANDQYSDAYDLSLIDTLSAGLAYIPGSSITSVGTISDPGIAGSLHTWNIANGTDIDVPENTVNATITYRVVVLDTILANQTLTNSAVIQWTSLDDDIDDVYETNERNGVDGIGGLNDYTSVVLATNVVTTDGNTIVTKVSIGDTSPQLNVLNVAEDVRIGDLVDYEITLSLQEGTSANVVLTDVLPDGMAFGEVVSINDDTSASYTPPVGGPFSYPDILAGAITVLPDTPIAGETTVRWQLGNIINAGESDANDGNNDFVIVYRARVIDHPALQPIANPVSGIDLQNDVDFDYDIFGGAALTETRSEIITVQQPNLSITKSLVTEFGDLILVADERITYTVEITNNGQSPAYDVYLEDIIPLGLRQANVTVLSTELPIGTVITPNITPTYDVNTGIAIFDFDTGVADAYTIPVNETLRIVYYVQADTGIGAGLSNIINTATVQSYYSFDNDDTPALGTVTGVRELYGPSNTASAQPLRTLDPNALDKANPTDALNNPVLDVSIGVPFTYTITVPDAPQGTALYDVRILDNLESLSPNVDLIFVDVQKQSANGAWVPTNTGTPTNLVIEDVLNGGIDIPAGEQAVIELTVVLRNSSSNVAGDTFVNLASYTFNSADNLPASQGIGGGDSDVALTIVEPTAMTLEKSGPALITYGTPETFTMNVQNIGNGPAYDITITDLLPNPALGGMCDTPPNNFTARVYQADGVTPVSIQLIENTHFITSFAPAPACTLSITMTALEAELSPLNRLIVTYDATLDLDNTNNSTLDNVAAVTQWFSADTPAGVVIGEVRDYNEIINIVTPGTPGILDHEDVYTTTVEAIELVIEKEVFSVITGAPAFTAEPAEDIRYEITITNIGPLSANNFSLIDEPDLLNGLGYFVSGSMANIVVSQATADVTNTDINAGTNAAGILDVRNLNLSAAGGGNDSLTISFEMTLQNVIDSGLIVNNQAIVTAGGFTALLSDDPNLPGVDEPTQTIIGSVPLFRTLKTSEDISGDVTVLEAGDILRYTITVQNIGGENSINTLLRDQVPANTSYVPNTTTLNGSAVADPAAGISPLQDGVLINALEDLTPGVMNANSISLTNIATVTFNVLIDPNVVNSTVISNQAFVGGDGFGSGPFAEQASDDPDTEILRDPTTDVIGNVAILDVQKTVEIIVDNGIPEQVDPGDTLHYTIVISNTGTIPATDVELQDNLPVNTTYVANSTTMNSVVVPDFGGALPIIPGLPVSSLDLMPILPAANMGTITPDQSAIVEFDVVVNAATANGTVISNQAVVTSIEFPDELSDADGNDLNGDQVTEIIVGSTQQLTISKDVFVVGGGTAQPGAVLEYLIHVVNTGASVIDLSTASPEVLKLFDDVDKVGLLNYVPGSARLNGALDPNVVYNAPRLIVNYDTSRRATSSTFMFEPGDEFTLRYLAQIDPAAQQGFNIRNTVAVDWGVQNFAPVDNITPITCSGVAQNVDACALSNLEVGGAPGVATISGDIWHDVNFDELQDISERTFEGWEVEIYFGAGSINPGDYLDSVFTDVNGHYTILGLVPNDGDALKYALRFRAPGASTDTASLGTSVSPFFSGNGPQTVIFFELRQSSHTPNISLPIQPNGLIHDAVFRTPVSNTVVQMINPAGIELPVSCFIDPAQQNQRTVSNGFYKFELNFSQPGVCDAGMDYTINVYPPAGYVDADSDPNTPNISAIIPPATAITGPAFDAVNCPSDPVGATLECEVQISELAAPVNIAPRNVLTDYYQKFTFSNGVAEDQIYHNHIAVDPELNDAIAISKTSSMVNVTRSQLVPYIITMNNTVAAPLYDLDLEDLFPAGFKYIAGSARIQSGNGAWVKTEPVHDPLTLSLTWADVGPLPASSTMRIKLLLVVGSGVGEGEYVNRARVRNNQTGGLASGEASATVRVVPDPTFDCSDVIGKVFDDKNLNAYQDEGEKGLPGARVVTARGLEVTADAQGRFHITCAAVPNPDRGSNFIIKLDERSLPTGYRLTTENPRVVRATRGKMVKFNFGAAIHRVVRLDMADAVFEPGTTEMRPQWLPRLDLLITELAKDPSLLRLSYLADNETESEVNDRLDAVKEKIEERWETLNCCYQLMIETEVFWRKGSPVDRGAFDD